MQIANYFIAMALSGKNVIVETHSDHIINRLVRRIVESETNQFKDLISVYFITTGENGSTYEEINIDDERGITNWPKEFFDQVANEQENIIRAGLNKRKSRRHKNLEKI
jgi:predicted ATPase